MNTSSITPNTNIPPVKTLAVVIGLPGAGKSTFVDEELVPLGFQVIAPDNIRSSFGHVFFGPLEPLVHSLSLVMARGLMLRGLPVVVDEAICMASHIRKWKRLAEDMGYLFVLYYKDTPIDECKRRRDDGRFPLEVIDRKAEQLAADYIDIKLLSPIVTIKDETAGAR